MFGIIDYFIFGSLIVVSTAIGVYFGFYKKIHNANDYLLGGKSLKATPIVLSLIASQFSGLTMLALPSDVYAFGANSIWVCLSITIAIPVTYYVYLPVIINLRSPSVFHYLELRFNRRVRLITSCVFILKTLIVNSIIAYIPAITFSQATGIHPYIIAPIVCMFCIFYTTIGAFKAVIWTDVFQLFPMIISMVTVFMLGVHSVGGFEKIYKEALFGHRLDFNFSADLTVRDGFWQIVPCYLITSLNMTALQPATVQKYLSISTFTNIKRLIVLYWLCSIFIHVFSIFTGIIVYAKYAHCDPISTGNVARLDQILTHFVIDVCQHIPGLPGIFIAGVFSATLSTLSSSFNSLAGIIYSDLVVSYFPDKVLKNREKCILRWTVVMYGSGCIALTFLIERVGSLQGFVFASSGAISGVVVGLYTLGILFPMAHSKGALWGTITSFFVTSTIVCVNQWYSIQGVLQNFAKPVTTKGCKVPQNDTLLRTVPPSEQPFILFRLSTYSYMVMSVLIVIIVGLGVSWRTKNKEILDPELISPILKYSKCRQFNKDYTVGTPSNRATYNFN